MRDEPAQILHRAKAAQRLQVAIAYAVVAWLLMQIAQIAFENYRARLNRLFDVESGELYSPE